ncbi:GNAT family N-acetyltransferase [Flectobacillus rivi]|uniref:GNAT family N-acetyltransferase n=1 Tax=Flectobacillus rivi TaxID=2984209 RepID=A0ABT6YXW1_9BACT|nr:GNAT family N-acetyltransferase [Flectobacillus rivi]MDI9873721.1 GNAT family N-acetyltransferase [Flectobacillus rivi]
MSTIFTLRAFREGDENALVKHANNPNVAKYLRNIFPSPYTHDDAVWWIDFNKSQKPPYTSLAICVDDAAVGCIGIILGQDIYECQAEIGYWLGEEYWGKGIMSEALKQMTTYTFEHFPQIQRIFAGVFDTNKASQKVLERGGYQLESIQPKSIIKEGRCYDGYLYVVLRGV